jgi:hypothetical protein
MQLQHTAPRYDRVITLTTVITVGLGLLVFLQQSPVTLPLPFLPGGPVLGIDWFIAIGLIVTAVVGADIITRSYTGIEDVERMWLRFGSVQIRTAPRYWILPALTVLGAELFLRLLSSGLALYLAVAIAATVFGGIMVAQYHAQSRQDQHYNLAVFGLNVVIYVVAFVLFTSIYVNRVRSLFSATIVFIIAALLTFELLHGTRQPLRRVIIYSLVCGLMVGETTWALNYWPASAVVGGVFLLVVFYALGGLVSNYFRGDLTGRVVAEFATVSLIGLGLVLYITFGG